MTQHHSLSTGKPSILSRRISFAGAGAIAAAAALMLSPQSAHAAKATKEFTQLKKELKLLGTDLNTASVAQLKTAIDEALVNKPSLKVAVLIGEALKSKAIIDAASGTAGAEFAAEVASLAADAATRQAILGLAAKTAGTGNKPNVDQVDEFTAAFLQAGDDILIAAKGAQASKSAVGAIYGGFSQISGVDRADITNLALADPKVSKSVKNIIAAVAANVPDLETDEYALEVAEANPKFVTQIAPGVAANDVQNSGEIVKKLIDSTDDELQKRMQKGVAAIAKSVAKVADIEQISLIGAYFAEKIGSDVLAPNGKALIPLAKAKSLTTTLAKAIIAKPSGIGALSAENRADEIAEVAAYIVGGIIGVDKGFEAAVKKAPKLVLDIITAAVKGGKASKKQKTQAAHVSYIADIVGSVANTIATSTTLTSDVKDAIKAHLLKASNLKKIGGVKADIIAAIDLGFGGLSDTLENGNSIADAIRTGTPSDLQNALDALVDPETDIRNFLAGS